MLVVVFDGIFGFNRKGDHRLDFAIHELSQAAMVTLRSCRSHREDLCRLDTLVSLSKHKVEPGSFVNELLTAGRH